MINRPAGPREGILLLSVQEKQDYPEKTCSEQSCFIFNSTSENHFAVAVASVEQHLALVVFFCFCLSAVYPCTTYVHNSRRFWY